MTLVQQKTLKNPIHCSGVGLHTGAKVTMTLLPAEPGSGVVFRRSDISGGGAEIKASWRNAIETPVCTTLIHQDGARISTVEHLLSALSGCGIDNMLIELSGPEVPIMDGSSAPFVFLIECAGTVEQDATRRGLRIVKPVTVRAENRSASVFPADGFSIHFEIDFDNPAVKHQEWFVELDPMSYKREIARARTFGFLHEVDELRARGLARGGSLDNAIVISGETIMNDGGLRYHNEFVRHKVLDAIGDLYLAEAPLLGRFRGVRAGHALNLRLLRALFADASAWRWEDLVTDDYAPRGRAGRQRAVAASA